MNLVTSPVEASFYQSSFKKNRKCVHRFAPPRVPHAMRIKNLEATQETLLKSKTEQLRGTCLLTRNPKVCEPCEMTARRFVRAGENSRELFSRFRGPSLYGDLLFSSASHFQSSQPPSYPAKPPSPNNRLKAIQLSPLYSVHFIFSLPCTRSLATPARGSGRWRKEALWMEVTQWSHEEEKRGEGCVCGVPYVLSQGLEMSNPCESLADT